MTAHMPSQSIQDFITRWKESAAAERANYQLFLSELCDVLEVARPQPTQADDEQNAYVFERAVTFHNIDGSTSTGRIDLYKRGCFVLEAKQGSDQGQSAASVSSSALESPGVKGRKGRRGTAKRGTRGWDVAMREAQGQAEQYVRALALSEGNPPFVIVVDVGYSIEIYSDFSRVGKTYVPFPDARSHRILIDDLTRDETRERLRLVWTDPMALDPSRRSARVTREVAERLAALARSLEDSGYQPERVANFLMRAIFTMFAEDVRLLPERGWTDLLESLGGSVEKFPQMVSSLWETMNAGGFSPIMRETLLRFNGGLFESVEALPITEAQLKLLIEASKLDWREVEPAIFGTLLERALAPLERQMRGAHYTPRAYVERLVMPTVIEPLREEWQSVLAAAITLDDAGKTREAAEEVKAFHRRLCKVRVLDPACGSGNFLYVTLEHLKRLEGEVLDALHGFGDSQGILEDVGLTVDPHQLLGIEKNPRATAITDLVLWIGYLQWHFRTRGEARPPEPVIKKFHNIECRDAVLAYDAEEVVTDEGGEPVTRWDGRTYKQHPVTGDDVPDETARVIELRYVNARKAEWPEADFIVGNPPFIGNARMRAILGDGYAKALRKTYSDIPESSDYVMYWWERAAILLREGKLSRFGFITTNSLRQTFNRKVLENHLTTKNPLSLVFAVPDHPWVDEKDGAAVRISMTVAEAGGREGILARVSSETDNDGEGVSVELAESKGEIFADLSIGANVSGTTPLKANESLSYRGVSLVGTGFLVAPDEAAQLGLGRVLGLEARIKTFLGGRDLTGDSRNLMVIDMFGLSDEEVRIQFPEIYQWLLERVKPERDQNNRAGYRNMWWVFGEPRRELRVALEGLSRYVATPRTAKHRFFTFLRAEVLPESEIIVVTVQDAFFLGTLSSRIHIIWSVTSGGWLGVGNDSRYTNTRCFEPFPFPDCTEQQKARIRELGEQLDAHRKRRQALHPQLAITEMYNVLEKLRANEQLNDKDRAIHEQGLISILRQLHDDLDRAVFDAYGWPHTLTGEEILERLVRLNSERAAEERAGLVRWLRPEYQRPAEGTPATFGKDIEATASTAAKKETKLVWPKSIPEQARAVRQALAASANVVTPEQLAKKFARANTSRVRELLQTLVSLGQAREVEAGRFVV
jgi:hypothetical protein